MNKVPLAIRYELIVSAAAIGLIKYQVIHTVLSQKVNASNSMAQ